MPEGVSVEQSIINFNFLETACELVLQLMGPEQEAMASSETSMQLIDNWLICEAFARCRCQTIEISQEP